MGIEFAQKINANIRILPDIGHYAHLQSPGLAIEEIRASFR
jgi:pimeloyl-ACP methyl ester carboxylesterase